MEKSFKQKLKRQGTHNREGKGDCLLLKSFAEEETEEAEKLKSNLVKLRKEVKPGKLDRTALQTTKY